MKTLNKFIEDIKESSYGGSAFNNEDPRFTLANWKRWEKKYEKDYNIFYDEDIRCYLIYTKSKGNNIGKHVGTYNAVDGIFYYDKDEIKDLYPKS